MGILELIVGLLIFLFLANIFLSLIPIPGGIVGTILAILVLVLVWRFVF